MGVTICPENAHIHFSGDIATVSERCLTLKSTSLHKKKSVVLRVMCASFSNIQKM